MIQNYVLGGPANKVTWASNQNIGSLLSYLNALKQREKLPNIYLDCINYFLTLATHFLWLLTCWQASIGRLLEMDGAQFLPIICRIIFPNLYVFRKPKPLNYAQHLFSSIFYFLFLWVLFLTSPKTESLVQENVNKFIIVCMPLPIMTLLMTPIPIFHLEGSLQRK